MEASGYSTWFVELLEGLGHRVLIGDAVMGGTLQCEFVTDRLLSSPARYDFSDGRPLETQPEL
jgi:hypothetical protein